MGRLLREKLEEIAEDYKLIEEARVKVDGCCGVLRAKDSLGIEF